ncbi:MAG: histidine phosphatase family protein [Williamsia sp.]|nr:histidine phosphatase family protein [Williamsia sp.]
MTKFLLIRHALTDSVGRSLSGRAPGVYLNAAGREQAQELAARLSHLPVAAIYSSPLERALETALPIEERLHCPTRINEDFLEIQFGDWTNKSFQELDIQLSFQRFNSFRSATRIPAGELMAEAQLRMIRGLEKLRLQHAGQLVAVISHSDLIKATIAYYAGIHLDLFQRIEISPASVSILEIGDDAARIILLNHTGELKL